MESFTLANFLTLGMLILLQAVLGIDNLLYISIESRNAPESKQRLVRNIGIAIAMILRLGLLFLIISIIKYTQEPIFHINWEGVITGSYSIHSMIVFFGGGFILYTAVKEILHMMSLEVSSQLNKSKKSSTTKVIIMIVIMNIVFSFDSILSAIALTDVFWVMATAIVLGAVLMMWLSEKVAKFLEKNRMYEVLGLFILFLVGVMLISEAGHLAHMKLFGNEITVMNKTTFYFIIAILVFIDIVQSRYQKKIIKTKKALQLKTQPAEATNEVAENKN